MYEELSYNPEIMKSQLSMLPPIEQFTLQQLANKRKVNFNMMLSLPFLLKDKQLEDRKDTIAIYRKRKFEPLQPQKHNIPLINSGRIHCTEFWSDKYQSTALRDSHIEKNLNKYRQIIKTNIQEYLIKFELQAKEQLEEARNIKYSEILKKQPSISEDDFVPTLNELNVSLCTQDEIFNFYREPKKYNVTQQQKTSLRNLDKITNSSLKQSYIDKFDKVISVCDRYSINSNRHSFDNKLNLQNLFLYILQNYQNFIIQKSKQFIVLFQYTNSQKQSTFIVLSIMIFCNIKINWIWQYEKVEKKHI